HGPALETIGLNTLAWPGHGTDPNVSFQYLDKEFMKPDEYDDYLFDPSGYFLKTYLPRIADVFEPFGKLPDFGYVYHTRSVAAARSFTDPDIKRAFETLAKAGDQQSKALAIAIQFVKDMAGLGFPNFSVSNSSAPFDLIADYYRGSKGAMLDMFRQPDKLLAAMEKARVFILNASIANAKGKRGKLVFIPLHWGLDGFMSPEQFNTFYWPQLRGIMMDLIDAGLVPYVFWEGDCRTRLETIADIPAGKAIYKFERTDMFRAKDILGDVVCIQGNVPGSLINAGTPQDVDDYCKKLTQGVKRGGGFILDGAVGVPDESKYENVVAMSQSVHKYGVYG
ncbi:MAG: uroporphyrinogen decarboxylase family protein, partial [Rhodospirillales bacterium]|nr:uroporphyrinogen decarboxylase family protein [Rhodospirillales bacterium]